MRTSRRPWFHPRTPVPLTGREPVLGAMRAQLAWEGPGWGSAALRGPRGAGASRLLADLAGERPSSAVVIGPVPEDAPEGEALRRAILASIPRDDVAPWGELLVDRGLREEPLLRWLLDGPEAGFAAPEDGLLRHAVRVVLGQGPLFVDDPGGLDPASWRVVEMEAGRGGLGVLAAGRGAEAIAGAVHELAPLAPAQMELLLRRWLHHPVTVRRLAPVLHAQSEGWPGRAVRIVRGLAGAGELVSESRGIRLAAWPPAWPEHPDEPPTHAAFVAALPGALRTLVEAAALQAYDEDLVLLARAAGVRRDLAMDLAAEVRALWPEAGPGLFPSRAERAALAGSLPPDRRRDLGRRLVKAWGRHRGPRLDGLRDGVARLRAALAAEDTEAIDRARTGLLRVLPRGAAPTGAVTRLLAETEAVGTLPAVPKRRVRGPGPATSR